MSSANNNYMIDDLNDNQHALDTQLQALHQSLSETINATTTATNKLTLSNPSNSSSSSSNSAMIVASSLVMNQERTANLRHQLSSCRQLLRQNQMTYRMLSANMPSLSLPFFNPSITNTQIHIFLFCSVSHSFCENVTKCKIIKDWHHWCWYNGTRNS